MKSNPAREPKESLAHEEHRRQFRESSVRVRSSTLEVMRELDPLIGEGLEEVRPLTKDE
jgi:hypothetical protein